MQTRTGEYVSDDAYATGVAQRAFYSAEQICNALRLPSDSAWETLRNKLVVPRSSAFSKEISGVNPPSPDNDGLVLLHPALLRAYANSTDMGSYSQLVDANHDSMLQAAQGPSCPAAFAAIAMLASDVARLNSPEERGNRIDACADWLMAQSSGSLSSLWGAASDLATSTASSILACVIYGFTRAAIRGYVTRDGIHSVPSSLVPGPATAQLPISWRVVRRRISRTTDQQSELMTQNTR